MYTVPRLEGWWQQSLVLCLERWYHLSVDFSSCCRWGDFEWVGCSVMCFLVKVLMFEVLRSCKFYSLLQDLSRFSLRVLAATGVSLRSYFSLGPSMLRLLQCASRTIVCRNRVCLFLGALFSFISAFCFLFSLCFCKKIKIWYSNLIFYQKNIEYI